MSNARLTRRIEGRSVAIEVRVARPLTAVFAIALVVALATTAPASESANRWTSVARASGISRGTTTRGRPSLRVTAAARWSRSLDSPRAMPATASVLAGTTTIPRAG